MSGIEEAIDRLELALRDAEYTERRDKENGTRNQSTAFDAGRVSGLKEALEIVREAKTWN
jgi:hypothetical protein